MKLAYKRYLCYEGKELQNYLEQMSQKGYTLTKTYRHFFVFTHNQNPHRHDTSQKIVASFLENASMADAKKNLLAEFISFLLALVFCALAYNAKTNPSALINTKPVRALFCLAYFMLVLSVLYLLAEVYNLMLTKENFGTRASIAKSLYKLFDCSFLIGYILLAVVCILNFSAIDFPENIILLLLPFCVLLDSSQKSFICSTISISEGIYFFIFLLSL